jgi:hypothetical protein
MKTLITFAELHAEVAAFHAAEAERNTPVNLAVSAIDALREAVEVCTDAESTEVFWLLIGQIPVIWAEDSEIAQTA